MAKDCGDCGDCPNKAEHKCPCGQDHESPFTPEMMEVFREWESATDAASRQHLLVELAELYAESVDETLLTTPESYLTLIEELFAAQTKYLNLCLRLGRALADSIATAERSRPLLEKLQNALTSRATEDPKKGGGLLS